jgi:hypothetical protein
MLTGLALQCDISANSASVGEQVILSICIWQASGSNLGLETDHAHFYEPIWVQISSLLPHILSLQHVTPIGQQISTSACCESHCHWN